MSRTFEVFKRKTFLLVRKRMSGAAAVDGQRRFLQSKRHELAGIGKIYNYSHSNL